MGIWVRKSSPKGLVSSFSGRNPDLYTGSYCPREKIVREGYQTNLLILCNAIVSQYMESFLASCCKENLHVVQAPLVGQSHGIDFSPLPPSTGSDWERGKSEAGVKPLEQAVPPPPKASSAPLSEATRPKHLPSSPPYSIPKKGSQQVYITKIAPFYA